MKRLLEGLQILAKYWPDGDVSAEHDVIYVGGPKEEMSAEDVALLEAIRGWFYEDQYDCWGKFT